MVTLESENAASTWLLNSLESFLILVNRLEVAFLSSSKAVFRRDFNCSVFLSFHNHDIFTIDHVWSKYKLSPLSILFMLLCTIYDSLSSTLFTPNLCTMVIWVVEFSWRDKKLDRKFLCFVNWHRCESSKMGIILEYNVPLNWFSWKKRKIKEICWFFTTFHDVNSQNIIMSFE